MHETNLRNLDLNLLVALEALLETGSVSKAAAEVNLSQPAMSRALERLRHAMKDPLLVRSGRSMVLTPHAESLRLPLQVALEQVRSLFGKPEFDPATSTASFRIMTPDYISHVVLPRILSRVFQLAPSVQIQVENISPDTIEGLSTGEVDLGIGVLDNGPSWPNAYSQKLFTDHLVCLMRKGHPLSEMPLNVEDYAKADHALVSITGRGGSGIDDRLQALGLSRRISLRLPHFLAIQTVVASTDLIVSLPARVARHIQSDALVSCALPTELDTGSFTVSQFWHERMLHDPARKWLRQMIKTGVEELSD